jgi:hypothetical protein
VKRQVRLSDVLFLAFVLAFSVSFCPPSQRDRSIAVGKENAIPASKSVSSASELNVSATKSQGGRGLGANLPRQEWL